MVLDLFTEVLSVLMLEVAEDLDDALLGCQKQDGCLVGDQQGWA